jgi:benzoate/toluate 1,2-dioxygenase subunit beta
MTATEASSSVLSRSQAEDLLYEEAARLDDGQLDRWLELFTDDAVYWVPSRFGPTDPSRQVSLIYDDRSRMGERVWRLTQGPAHAQIPASATRRLVSNVRVLGPETEPGVIVVRSNFAIFESRKDVQRSFAGAYEHHLRHDGGTWKIALKKATLVNAEATIFNLTFMI